MVEKNGKWPANARVDVDYSKGKPRIKFTYPKNGDSPEKQAEKQNRSGPISGILLLVIVMIPFILILMSTSAELVDAPKNCSVILDNHYINISWYTDINGINTTVNKYREWTEGANFTCENKTYMVYFRKIDDKRNGVESGFYFKSQKNPWERANEVLFPFYILIILFSFHIIVKRRLSKYLIRQRWYQKWLPKYQADGWFKNKTKRYMKFEPSDVENKMVEIPLFSNVELDYKTHGNFSDQLVKIKIREHRYNKYRKGKVGKEKVRLGEWYARFYFKDKPKDGYLEVIFQ